VQKLRVNENKQTEYTKKLMKENPCWECTEAETNATVFSGQWERTGLGGICDVEIGYQVSSMREFGCGDPFGFVSSVFIP